MSYDELYNHKKSDTVKWILTLLAFIVVGVLLAGIICGWFTKKEELPEEEQTEQTDNGSPVTNEDGNVIASNAPIALPMAMTFRSAMSLDGTDAAYDSVTVNATIEPYNADVRTVAFTAAWKNASSSWASGKSVGDYLTVTQQSENSTKAEIKCLQPFGEQIVVSVVVTGLDSSSATADCTVDFAKRIEAVNFSVKDNSSYDLSAEDPFWAMDFSNGGVNFYESVVYSDYTVDDTFDIEVMVSSNEAVVSQINSDMGISIGATSKKLDFGGPTFNGYYVLYGFNWCLTPATPTLPAAQYQKVKEWLVGHTDAELFTFEYAATGTYSNYSFEMPIRFNEGTVAISVTGVTLDQTGIII